MQNTKGKLADELEKLMVHHPDFDAQFFKSTIISMVVCEALDSESAARTCVLLLQSPLPGVPAAGREMLELFSENGSPSATLNLAVALCAGHGGPANPARAVVLLQALSNSEALDPELKCAAVGQLAQCYREGIGVSQDTRQAVELYAQAVQLGDAEAAYAGGLICQGEGDLKLPTGPDYTRAGWFYAMNQNDLRCVTNLGLLHLRGLAPNASVETGMTLLVTAATQGDETALDGLRAYAAMGAHAEEALQSMGRGAVPRSKPHLH